MARTIGYGMYAGIPGEFQGVLGPGPHVLQGPGETCPLPGALWIGRPVVPDGTEHGDSWEYEFVKRGRQGGRDYAAYCLPQWQKARWCVWWVLANEPLGNTREELRLLVEYYLGAQEYARIHAPWVLLLFGNWSRGRPDENILDELLPALAVCDGLAVHEYGLKDMRAPEDFLWHCFRYRRILMLARLHHIRLKVFVTELGLCDVGEIGWRRFDPPVSEESYAEQLKWYLLEARRDPEFMGAVFFCLSGYNPWPPFFASLGLAWHLTGINALPDGQAPITENKPVSDKLRDALQAEFGAGFSDLRAVLPKHATVRYPVRPETAIKRLVVHHTTGAPTLTWEWMARYHINERDYAGVAYHIGVQADGHVSYLTNINEASWHCGTLDTPEDDNWDTLAISALGDYHESVPPTPLVASLKRVVMVLDRYFGQAYPIIGHRDVSPKTACPGQYLYARLPDLRGANPTRLRQEANAKQAIRFNPDAALQKAIFRDGFVPNSDEFPFSDGGIAYVAQRAEHLGTGVVRVYYCRLGDYANVYYSN